MDAPKIDFAIDRFINAFDHKALGGLLNCHSLSMLNCHFPRHSGPCIKNQHPDNWNYIIA